VEQDTAGDPGHQEMMQHLQVVVPFDYEIDAFN
jgi:hypothetical protein